jgi:hypothetical protein
VVVAQRCIQGVHRGGRNQVAVVVQRVLLWEVMEAGVGGEGGEKIVVGGAGGKGQGRGC